MVNESFNFVLISHLEKFSFPFNSWLINTQHEIWQRLGRLQ
jgi:hypothetical protein